MASKKHRVVVDTPTGVVRLSRVSHGKFPLAPAPPLMADLLRTASAASSSTPWAPTLTLRVRFWLRLFTKTGSARLLLSLDDLQKLKDWIDEQLAEDAGNRLAPPVRRKGGG